MRDFFHRLKLSHDQAVGFASCALLRGLERRLSLSALYRILWPVYTGRAALNELFKRPQLETRGPEWLRYPVNFRARLRRRRERYFNCVLEMFPDRLARPEWLARCQLEGAEHLQAAQAAGRPAVLAFYHFGAFFLLRHWLRAHGFPVAAFIGGSPETRGRFRLYMDQLTPFPEVRLFFYPGQLRAVAEFLATGNVLCMAVDTPVGKQTRVSAGRGWTFAMNAGAARLAARHCAELLHCSLVNEGAWRYRLCISPTQQLAADADEGAWHRANTEVMQHQLRMMQARPADFVLPRGWNPFQPTAR